MAYHIGNYFPVGPKNETKPLPLQADAGVCTGVCVCCMRFLWCSKWSITIAMFEENILWQTERKSRQTIGRQQQKWLSCNLRRLFFSSVSLSKQIKIIPRSKSTNQSVCLLFIITCCVHCNQEWDRDFGGSKKKPTTELHTAHILFHIEKLTVRWKYFALICASTMVRLTCNCKWKWYNYNCYISLQ